MSYVRSRVKNGNDARVGVVSAQVGKLRPLVVVPRYLCLRHVRLLQFGHAAALGIAFKL